MDNTQKPMRTEIVKSVRPLVEPIVSRLAPALSAIPELLLPAPQAAGTTGAPKGSRWALGLLIVISALAVLAVAAWLLVFRTPGQQERGEVSSVQTQKIVYRPSTIPQARLVTGDTTTLEISRLDPAPDGASYTLYGLSMSGQSPTVSNLTPATVVGSFDVDAQSKPIISGNRINAVPATADTVVLALTRGESASIVLTGKLVLSAEDATRSAEMRFPLDLDRAQGSLAITSYKKSATADLVATFNDLPDVRDLGWNYEARLVQFIGSQVGAESILSQFSRTAGTTIVSFPSQDIDQYTDLIVSLEPVWSTDATISQPKPYTALIKP